MIIGLDEERLSLRRGYEIPYRVRAPASPMWRALFTIGIEGSEYDYPNQRERRYASNSRAAHVGSVPQERFGMSRGQQHKQSISDLHFGVRNCNCLEGFQFPVMCSRMPTCMLAWPSSHTFAAE